MGKPLVKAKLTWSLVARDISFKPEGLDDFAFCNGTEDFRLNRALDRISQFNAQGEADLDASGLAKVATPLPINSKAPQPRATKLLCEVTDLSQQTVSESRAFVQQSSDFYFGLRRFDAVFKEGAPLPIELIAVGLDGKALTAPVKSTLRLRRFTWQTNRLAAAGDIAEFDSKVQLEVVWERELSTMPGAGTDRKPIAATLPDVVAGKPGEYLLEASGKDAQGHDVLTSINLRGRRPRRNGLELSESLRDRSGHRQGELRAGPDGDDPGENADRGRRARHRRARSRPAFVCHAPQRQLAFHPGAGRGNGRAECFRLGHALARRE